MKCLKIPFKDAEKVRKILTKHDLINFNYKFEKDKNNLYLPINSTNLPKSLQKFEIKNKILVKRQKELTFEDQLKKLLTKKELSLLTRAYDVVGKIAIMDIPVELYSKEKKIGEALLSKNITTVLRKNGIHSGKFRTQKLKYLAGIKTKETIHRENGFFLKLNVEDVYFSVRSGNERLRIKNKVKPNENILVMFSGCAPFVLACSKANVTGVELNPIAHKYAEENLKLNKITNVKLYNKDVRKVKLGKFDRIIMPLPKSAEDFLDLAIKHSKPGTLIHLYLFLCDSTTPKAKKRIKEIFGKTKYRIQRIVKCGQHSPGVYRCCLDIKVL